MHRIVIALLLLCSFHSQTTAANSAALAASLERAIQSESRLETKYWKVEADVSFFNPDARKNQTATEIEQVIEEFTTRAGADKFDGVEGLLFLREKLDPKNERRTQGHFPIVVEWHGRATAQQLGDLNTTGISISKDENTNEAVVLDPVNRQVDVYFTDCPYDCYGLPDFLTPVNRWLGNDAKAICSGADLKNATGDFYSMSHERGAKRRCKSEWRLGKRLSTIADRNRARNPKSFFRSIF